MNTDPSNFTDQTEEAESVKRPEQSQEECRKLLEKAEFFKRAGQSQEECRKLLISLSTASLGVVFIILTNERAALLSLVDRKLLFVAVTLMSSAVLFGVLAWSAAGKDFHDKATNHSEYKGQAHSWKKYCDGLLLILFVSGILVSSIYLARQVCAPNAQKKEVPTPTVTPQVSTTTAPTPPLPSPPPATPSPAAPTPATKAP